MRKYLLILLPVFFFIGTAPAHAAITFDHASQITTDTSGTTLTSNTFTINSGDTLAVFQVYFGNPTIGSPTFTCTVGTTVFVTSNLNSTSENNIFTYYINAPTVGTGTCTQTTTSGGSFMGQTMALYKGTLTSSSPLDSGATTNTCTAASSCTISLSGFGANDWVTVQGASNNNPPGPSTNLTSRIVDPNGWSALDSNGAIGATSGSFTATSSSGSIIQLVGEAWIPAPTASSVAGVFSNLFGWF